jgi:hypothetical protein
MTLAQACTYKQIGDCDIGYGASLKIVEWLTL